MSRIRLAKKQAESLIFFLIPRQLLHLRVILPISFHTKAPAFGYTMPYYCNQASDDNKTRTISKSRTTATTSSSYNTNTNTSTTTDSWSDNDNHDLAARFLACVSWNTFGSILGATASAMLAIRRAMYMSVPTAKLNSMFLPPSYIAW